MKLAGPLDLERNELRDAVTENRASAPTSPVAGLRYFDTGTKVERYWDGTQWVNAGGAVSSVDGRSGAVVLSDLYVNVTGDTMTGQLSAPVVALGTNPAGSGVLRLANDQLVRARNGANSADVDLLKLTSADVVQVGGLGNTAMVLGAAGVPVSVPYVVRIGTNPSTTGSLGLPNGAGGAINFRSGDGTVNYSGLWLDATNALQLGGPGMTVNIPGSLKVSTTIDAGSGFRHGDATKPIWTAGAGAPEGVVTAPVGSIFSRTDGTTNTALYRKETGTGNTGWLAVSTPTGGVTSVDGRTGVVTLSDLYVNVTGDNMTGSLGLGVPSPNAKLHFADDTGPGGGILFGTDTNLYRRGANILTTDDTFTSGGYVQSALSTTAGGFRHGASGPIWVAGTGTPEGVVYAVTGSIYSRTDGTTDTALYRKETGGAGNFGWVPVAAAGSTVPTHAPTHYAGGADPLTGRLPLAAGGGNSSVMVGLNSAPANAFNVTAIGWEAMKALSSTSANNNTAVGYRSLQALTTGTDNVGVGASNGTNLTTGAGNTIVGNACTLAAATTRATAVGYSATATTDDSVAVGAYASVTHTGGVAIAGTTTAVNDFVLGGAAHLVRVPNKLGIGVAPTSRLSLVADTTAAGGIAFGADTNIYRSAANQLSTDDAFTALNYRQGLTGPTWTSGTGNPEGVISAPVGSMYSRTDGGTGTATWRKESGTGNTGWVADAASAGGVASVDGRTGTVTLSDLYVNVSGDTMTGPLAAPDLRHSTARLAGIGAMASRSLLPQMLGTWADRFQHATISACESWNGSAWVALAASVVQEAFSGHPASQVSLNPTTYPKWRVTFSGMSSSYASILHLYQEWSGGNTWPYKVTLEESADGAAWTALLAETDVPIATYYATLPTTISYGAYVRLTIEHTSTTANYSWRQIRFLSDRMNGQGGQQLGLPFTWNYFKETTFTNAVAVGPNPATTGSLRLPNNTSIRWRNAANNADYVVLQVDGSNNTLLNGWGFGVYFAINGNQRALLQTNNFTLSSGVVMESPSGFRLGAASAPSWTSGAGSPEGVIAAPVGSMYSRTDGGADTALYRKESGVGATGWVAVADVYVNTAAPPTTPNAGDLWYDTDDASGFVLPLSVAEGGTGGTSTATARSNLAVPYVGNSTTTAGGPTTGTYVRGDHWLDSNNTLWLCTAGGSPGTWVLVPGSGNSTTTAGAPTTGTWVRGDSWLDSNNVLWTCTVSGTPGTWVPPVGYEMAYAQATSNTTLSATIATSANVVVSLGSVVFDGTPVLIGFFATMLMTSTTAGSSIVLDLWDGSTRMGELAQIQTSNQPAAIGSTIKSERRITPTPGAHTYSVRGWSTAGTNGIVYAATGDVAGNYSPAFIRITRV